MSDHGDLVDSDNEEEVEDLEENAEPLLLYFQPPFYYPIRIGDVVAQRYRIEHKLGHGGFSTVWMAHDAASRKDVALKITVPVHETADSERTMHQVIRQRVPDTSQLLLSCEAFSLASPHGQHRVLVFPLQGPSLYSCLASMSMAHRMSVAKQVLQALKSLHDAHIVHRDLSDKNILCGMVPLDACDRNQKYQYLGRPRKIPFQTPAGTPGELVRPVIIPSDLLTGSVFLGDFGQAMLTGTTVNYKPQSPSAWCAPERLHNIDPSTASDIWSYMCIFSELYLGTLPWSIYGNALPGIVAALGPLPLVWHSYYHQSAGADVLWYDPNTQPTSPLQTVIAHCRPDTSPTERAHVLSFMLRAFCYDPRVRISAAQLLCDVSFRSVLSAYGAE